MMTFFARYDFLLLALLFCLPPLLIAAARPDLRPLMRRAALLALPFALTERFFYPESWSPTFLFDLIDQLGFGLEDLLFVAAFGAFAATAYPALARRQIVAAGPPRPRLAAALIAGSITTALLLHTAGISMYGATIAAELAALALLLRLRRDLALPALVGLCSRPPSCWYSAMFAKPVLTECASAYYGRVRVGSLEVTACRQEFL